MGALIVIAILVPLVMQDGPRTDRARIERLTADTLRLGQRRRAAETAVARAESTLIAARTAPGPAPVVAPRPARPLAAATAERPVSEFARLIAEARRDDSNASALAVAAHPAVSAGPRMRSLADSLRALDERRRARPTEELARAIARARLTILSIAETRERELGPAAPVAREESAPIEPLSVAAPVSPGIDTVALVVALSGTRDSLTQVQRALDSSVVALRIAGLDSGAVAGGARFTPAILFVVVLVTGLLVRFIAALRHELQEPTLAGAAEAERLTGMRILTVVRDAPLDGPARFKPSGVDPFRMLYLGLTATGTRARTAVITGAESEIAAAVGARLAIAAAADHRSTLILDCDPSRIAVSRTFRERAEPGLCDVLAKAFTWREVARPVGSSDGLLITLLPAGTERDDLATGAERDALVADFARLRASYELTLAVAAPTAVGAALELIEASPVLFTVVVGETPIDRLLSELDALRAEGRKLQGLVLWSAPLPNLPSRAELAALLATRKGRTPGGSFAAVQQVLGNRHGSNKT